MLINGNNMVINGPDRLYHIICFLQISKNFCHTFNPLQGALTLRDPIHNPAGDPLVLIQPNLTEMKSYKKLFKIHDVV